jgi:ABC-type glycerol-3-phosphate transport system substrate-binding protein
MKKIVSLLLLAGALAAGASTAAAADTAPKTVIHVITVAFKAGTTPAQISAMLDGVKKLPADYPGITRVWTNAIKVQNPEGAKVAKTHVIVMEFASEQALKDYTDSSGQKKWYELYLPIREVSTTYDITN